MDIKIANWLDAAPGWFAHTIRGPGGVGCLMLWDDWSDRPVIVCSDQLAALIVSMQQRGELSDLIVSIRYEGEPLQIKEAAAYRPK